MPDEDDIASQDPGSTTETADSAEETAELDVVLAATLATGPETVPEPAADEEVAQETADETEPAPSPLPTDSADAALVEAVSGGLTWIPFACYLGSWVVLAGLSAYFLYGADADQPARWMPEYVPLLWSGISLTALGPILSVIVWLVARARRAKGERRGLFASAMTRGALVAFFGVAIWIATLFVLELVAAGGTL